MAGSTADVLVLGAGMVGVSAALHLQARGREVVLVDKHGVAGEETSFGNAGLIERASVFPYIFPRDLPALLRYVSNRSPEAHYHLSALPRVVPWLFRYFLQSAPGPALRSINAALPLIERSVSEHEALMRDAGVLDLLRRTGWMKIFRSEKSLEEGLADVERMKPYGLNIDILNPRDLADREPNLMGTFAGALHMLDTCFVPDPGALAKAYATLFVSRGGHFLAGDAKTVAESPQGWSVHTGDGVITAKEAVVALGPWSDDITRPLGYRIPLGIKRGYHRHFKAKGNAVLRHPVFDADGGYVLTPMLRGIRLTTGAEFADRDAPATPVQLRRTEETARHFFPLGEPLDPQAWMGRRPCLPDMLPIIGRGGRHKGLWFDFGHQHHGFTLGPASGRLLAEMMTGEPPFTDPKPYEAARFA